MKENSRTVKKMSSNSSNDETT